MINALVISNNVYFIKSLLDELSSNDLDIKISHIVTSYSNIIGLLNSSKFRIVFVDESVAKSNSRNFFKLYNKKIISLSYKASEKMLRPNTIRALRRVTSFNDLPSIRALVVKELTNIGYKLKYKGTNYLADAIAYILFTNCKMVDNLQNEVYPIVAKKYSKSPNNIKSSMTKATESMYFECDAKVLQEYFGFCIETKPTVKQVIFTVVNKL